MELTSILIYLIIIIASTAVYFLKRNLNYWKKQGIPHEEPHYIMGNLAGFRKNKQFGHILAEYYHKFKGTGPFAGIFLIQRPGVLLLEKEAIKQVLIKDFNNFTDRGFFHNEKNDPLTGHLFFLDGQKWRTLRNKLSPTFTSGKMKFMYPTLLQVTDKFMQVLSENVKQNSILEMRDLLGRFTIDIIGSCVFGIECNSLNNPDTKFVKLGRKAIEVPRHNKLLLGFMDSFPDLARKLGFRALPDDVHHFFMKTVTDTITYREQHNVQRNDFLNILMELKNDKSNINSVTIEEICAQSFIFYLAGFETSSSTMSIALYELALHQDLQDRLREEVNEVFSNFKDGEDISYEAIMDIPYLEQVISETLRKYPTLPMLNRQALSDYTMPGHPNYVIKKGMPVLIPIMGIQHDPEFYPKPEEFDPERFTPEMVKQRDSVEWLPFGDGPRNCIGVRFGKMQMRLGLAFLIKHFRFTVCSKTEIPITFDPKSLLLIPTKLVNLNVEAI